MTSKTTNASSITRKNSGSSTGVSGSDEIDQYDSVSQTGSRKHSFISNNVLADPLKEHLRQAFKAYNIVFTDSKHSPDHSYASSSRALERQTLVDYAKQVGQNIIVIGAHVTSMIPHILDPNYNYHLCCPIMENRDVNRRIDHLMHLNHSTISEERITIIKESVCNKQSQDCDYKADVGIFCHSMYDITPENVGDIMDKHDLSIIYGCGVFAAEILINDSGIIPILNMHYKKDHEQDLIYMDFENDSALGYIYINCQIIWP